jgi:copper homeostasis protein (lipoprotein)
MKPTVVTMATVLVFATMPCVSFQAVCLAESGVPGSETVAIAVRAPVTYFGVLPCVYCKGLRLTLSLRPDRLFLLRQTYLSKEKNGRDKTLVDLGVWSTSKDGSRLILRGGTELQRQFEIRSANTLRKLDTQGREIRSAENYDLARSEAFEHIEDAFRMRWMYVRRADLGLVIDCLTGKRFPVARDRDVAALEAAYTKAHPADNLPLVVIFDGHLALRAKTEGPGEEEVVVVDKFLRARSGESCMGEHRGGVSDIYWKLVELNGEAAVAVSGENEPHLRLEPVLQKISGSGGCNAIRGSVQLNAGILRITPVVETGNACSESAIQQEGAFLKALGATTTYRRFSEALELYAEDRLLARFEAQPEQK